jgi:DNA polymerase III gamma/tau subunit
LHGDGQQVMSLLSQAASRGVEWEALLVEMLRLLHQIAMRQIFTAHQQGLIVELQIGWRHHACQFTQPERVTLR